MNDIYKDKIIEIMISFLKMKRNETEVSKRGNREEIFDGIIDEISIEIPPKKDLGEYSVPCFRFAQTLRTAPVVIAQGFVDYYHTNPSFLFEKIEQMGPYINFYVERKKYIQTVLNHIEEKFIELDSSERGKGTDLKKIQMENSSEVDRENLEETRKEKIRREETPHDQHDQKEKARKEQTREGKTRKSKTGYDKRVTVLDFSSPNIAKPFSIAHLRSTSIGESLARILSYLGNEVIRINHLGDWGTSFGKLILAYQMWGSEVFGLESEDQKKVFEGNSKTKGQESVQKLLDLYVRFHQFATPELEEEARTTFQKLEKGDPEMREIWSRFKEISLREFQRLYDRLGVKFDYYWGESFYQERIPKLLEELAKKGFSQKSQSALVVELEGMPPLLLKKRNESTLYATRDLACALYRWEQFRFDEMLYVVGSEQKLHFEQIFRTLKLLGRDWSDSCYHVSFGLMHLKEGRMSTREGKVIFLENVLEKAKELALMKMQSTEELKESKEAENPSRENQEKNREEKTKEEYTERHTKEESTKILDLEERAFQLALSSILFWNLKTHREKDISFDWDEMLNPKGETGIYLQYAHARLFGIFRKFNREIAEFLDSEIQSEITEETSFEMAQKLALFEEKLAYCAKTRDPSVLARYLIDLAQAFSSYYRVHRVIDRKNLPLSWERIRTVRSVQKILRQGLWLLGIEALEKI